MKERLVMQHIPCRLILTVVTQHQFQDETYHGPWGIKLQSEFSPYSPRQACSDLSLDFKPQTGLQTMKLQSPHNSPNSCHQSVAAQDSSPQSWRDITEYFCWQTANCFPLLWLLQLNFKEETRILIVTAKNCKAGAKKSKQGGGENKLWIGEFRRTLRPGLCAIIKQRTLLD